MKTLVLCLIVGLARADIGLLQRGYEYKVPHTTYGVPSHSIQTDSVSSGVSTAGASTGAHNFGSQVQAAQSGQGFGFTSQGTNTVEQGHASYIKQGSHPGYHSPGYHHHALGVNYHQQSQGATFAQQSQGSNFVQQAQAGYQQAGYQTSGTAHREQSYQHNYVQPQIFRHIYVHAAPEEHEEKVYRQAYVPPQPQKHYKIIFIKAPTQSAGPVQVIPQHPQTEEKTIVYVLVKKQDAQNEIVLPKVPVHKPSKPEVYFIKYDAKKDGVNEQGVINNIVSNIGQSNAGHLSGVTVTDVSGSVLSDEASGGIASGIASAVSSGTSSGFSSGSTIADEHNTGYTQVSDAPYPTGISASQSSFNQGEHTYTHGVQSDQSSSGLVSTEIASHDHESNNIHSSIGLPHETYGPPKFRA